MKELVWGSGMGKESCYIIVHFFGHATEFFAI